MELDYQPPFDTRLELHIIGAMIKDPECIADVVELVKPKFFYHRQHARVFEKIIEFWSKDEKSVDLELMAPSLTENQVSISGMIEAASSIFSTADIANYCERLKDLASLRAAGKIGEQLVKATQLREQEEIRAAIGKAELDLSRLNEATIRTDTMVSMKDAVMKFHEQFEKVYYGTDGGVSGIPTGLTDLDALTAGLHKTDLIIIGARPAMGKTSFAQQIALNVSLQPNGKPGYPVAFFSLEQSTDQLARRAMANQAMIDLSKLNSGLIEDQDWEKYTKAMGLLTEANLVIDDQPGLTVNEIKAKCRKIKRERGLSLILIDYLGKIRAPDPRMNRYEAVSENARMLKDMAKEFDVPVICLAQLSRSVEQRQDKRPMMSDLRESGEIEQEADIIAFLYRDDYYNSDSAKKGITELILAKHRNGPTGLVEMIFLKQFNRFVNLDRGGTENAEQLELT
ncbi:replicative DNA helicase [Cohnella xylanilytica]|uniref:replicative DNA helicase n=1 Tax=Cohnella xylanilytica TaxID=557555 RepID=UPI001B0CB256|nr:replicative DNA helicase [Cohnella xylanilytica]GIO13562.1 replicative DNA helicase [Cohnella xylanilytica]